MTRDSTSRPSSSVPNQYAVPGALRIAPQLVASGSQGDPRREQRDQQEEGDDDEPGHRRHTTLQLAPAQRRHGAAATGIAPLTPATWD